MPLDTARALVTFYIMMMAGGYLIIFYTLALIRELRTHMWHWNLGDTIAYIASIALFAVSAYLIKVII